MEAIVPHMLYTGNEDEEPNDITDGNTVSGLANFIKRIEREENVTVSAAQLRYKTVSHALFENLLIPQFYTT